MRIGSQSFKRLVLGLQPSAPDRMMQFAVELADLLHLELLGLFLEDTNLRAFASIPFARELRLLGGGWHPIDLDRLSHELDLVARSTERTFTQAAKRLSTPFQFEVIRGQTAEAIESISRTDDIIMILEPVSPAERVTQQFSWLMEAAFRSAAAVMLVPSYIARTTGPVVAIAADPDDPSIQTAAAIAMAAEEDLIIIEIYKRGDNDQHVNKLAVDTGLAIKRIAVGDISLTDPDGWAQLFRYSQERLVVMTRGVVTDEVVSLIASSRRVPVFVIEPQDTSTAVKTRIPSAIEPQLLSPSNR